MVGRLVDQKRLVRQHGVERGEQFFRDRLGPRMIEIHAENRHQPGAAGAVENRALGD